MQMLRCIMHLQIEITNISDTISVGECRIIVIRREMVLRKLDRRAGAVTDHYAAEVRQRRKQIELRQPLVHPIRQSADEIQNIRPGKLFAGTFFGIGKVVQKFDLFSADPVGLPGIAAPAL